MKYYILTIDNRMQLFGTQVLAKKANPDFDPDRDCIEIAVDKEGLMAFVNEMLERIPVETEDTEPKSKAAEYGAELVPASEIDNPDLLNPTDRSIWFDDEFPKMHITRQLGFAEMAVKNASSLVHNYIKEEQKPTLGAYANVETNS